MSRSPDTIAAAAYPSLDSDRGAVVPPLHLSDSYLWADADSQPGHDYSRTVNPNRDQIVDVLAKLEGAKGGEATASGQAALLLALLLVPGDALVIAPHDCYGGTYRLLEGLAARQRLRAAFIDFSDPAAVSAAMADSPALVIIETPSNPLMALTDIRSVCDAAHAVGALVMADNTVPTPVRQRPLALGCDLVMHSTTKAINGHGDCVGGVLLARDAELVERIRWWGNAAGLNASPQGCWQTLRGVRTLPLRIDRAEASAQRIADYLVDQPIVEAVHYPGLETHPDYELALRQQSGPGFMLSFTLKGGEATATTFTDQLELVTLASSLGAHASLICVPAKMTHRGMSSEAQATAGITPGLLRLSVGLENVEDIIADLSAGCDAVKRAG